MARINRSDIIQKAVNDLAISTSTDKVPNETLDKVQLTYDLNRRFSSFLISGNSVTSATLTITPPSGSSSSEVYLTSIQASFIKDVICDQATGNIRVTAITDESGVSKNILEFAVLTSTAQTDSVTITLPYPLKIKQGSTLQMNASYTAGAMSRSITAIGFVSSSN